MFELTKTLKGRTLFMSFTSPQKQMGFASLNIHDAVTSCDSFNGDPVGIGSSENGSICNRSSSQLTADVWKKIGFRGLEERSKKTSTQLFWAAQQGVQSVVVEPP